MIELEELGQTWNEAQAKSQDRVEWRRLIAALCPVLKSQQDLITYNKQTWYTESAIWQEHIVRAFEP